MITMKDIAREAGVSRPTVSQVLNNRHTGIRITDATRERILATAERLGYCRNEIACSMVTGKTNVIGFIGLDLAYDYVSRILNASLMAAINNNFSIKLIHINRNPGEKELLDIIKFCVGQRLSGVIVRLHDRKTFEFLYRELSEHNIKVALVNSCFSFDKVIQIDSDDIMGGKLAVKHLAQLGHENIAFLAGVNKLTSSIRKKGFLKGMKAMGLSTVGNLINLDDNIAIPAKIRIEQAAATIFSERKSPPTAIVCAGDIVAMLVLRTAFHHGLKVPESLSVIGFGNLEFTDLAIPALTTIEQPFEEMGRIVVEKLIQKIRNNDKDKDNFEDITENQLKLPVKLVIRDSTGKIMKRN